MKVHDKDFPLEDVPREFRGSKSRALRYMRGLRRITNKRKALEL
jgi:hypothetical protein